ncbi:MAG: AAA family ATPase, partial [Clostridia bacterium]|nr:AAA family ATPase [Clostridia bacterium]
MLDYARNKYGAGGSSALICESVLLAAIDVALREVEDHIAHGREHWMIYRMLRRQFPEDPGFGQIREALTGYLATESSNEMTNILVFQARMHRAEAKAVSDEKEELTPSDLLSAILADPTEQIKSCIPGPEDDESAFEADDDNDNGETIEIRVEEPDTPEKNVERLAQVTEETKKLYTELNRRVLGQQNAVSVFASGYFQSQLLSMTEAERKKPNATFLFAGPPGVGKTFLAENVADILGLPFYRADMSGYSDKEAAIEFAGSDRVYKNAKSGNVTSFVHENPKCVLLFDEIEKAHINVIHLFLQILDAGRLRDAYTDEEVSFTDALMIFTTNAGRQIYEDSESPDLSGISRKVIIIALQTDVNPATKEPFFPAAICSRFASGNVVMFNHVTAGALMSIVETELRRHADNFEKRFGIDISIDERVAASLLFAEGGASDARTMRARAEAFFNGETFELFRLLGSKKVGNGIKSLKKVEFSVELPEEDKEIAGLFEKESPCTLLAFTSRSKIKKCVESCPSVRFLEAHSAAEAERKLRENDVDDVLIDIGFGRRGDAAYLNVEDVDSEARDLLKYLSDIGSGIPVYILESGRSSLSNEERDSFNRRGVRGYITLSGASDPERFDRDVKEITHSQQMQRSMEYLARSCKVVSFDTAQLLDDSGTRATVKLFDFRLHPAVDAEDASSVLSSVSKPDVLFETVIGAEEAKKELRYFVDYLKNPRKYLGTGLSAPKGVLLYGPPGTGKTMLAKAVAGESDVTFISAEGNQFVNQFQGVGRDRLKKLFSIARKYAPSILFIDEIDAIAGARTGASGDNATLTALLTEMDGFS